MTPKATYSNLQLIMQNDSIRHDADVILRSSDGMTFHCWSALLSASSSIFSDMFSLPQPDTSEPPIVDLTEDGCTLGHIVSFCHPPSLTGSLFKPDSVEELEAVLEAARKYEMQDGLRGLALEKLSNPCLFCQDPLKMYALACLYKCYEAAQLAALHTLALPALTETGYIPGREMHRLIHHRDRCVEAACAVAENHEWINCSHFSDLFGHGRARTTVIRVKCPFDRSSSETETVNVYGWWMEYMKKSRRALRESPRGNTVKNKELVDDVFAAILSSKRKSKVSKIWMTFQSFVEAFAEKIDSQVEEVKISFAF